MDIDVCRHRNSVAMMLKYWRKGVVAQTTLKYWRKRVVAQTTLKEQAHVLHVQPPLIA